jgi:glycosyltransferase involved in cell wall biosynthesis
MKVSIFTSKVGKSLQKVSEHIGEVLVERGHDVAIILGDHLDPEKVDFDSAIIVMPVDLVWCVGYFYLWYRISTLGKPVLYYGTIEGEVKNPQRYMWVRDRLWFIANSNYTKRKLENAGFEVKDVIYHGVKTDFFSDADLYGRRIREKIDRSGDKFIVGYIASSHVRKGHMLAAKVMERVKKRDRSIRFLVVSEIQAKRYYENLDNVIFIPSFGKLTEDGVKAFYGALDLYAHFALAEGFGLPVLEALAAGRMVVHAMYEPLTEITTRSVSFRVPVRTILWYSEVSGINFELHVYDVDDFADTIIEAKETIMRMKKDEIRDLTRSRASEFDVRRVYPRFADILEGKVKLEMDPNISLWVKTYKR